MTSIVPDGRIETRTFTEEAPMGEWISQQDGSRNVYFTVNSTGDKILEKKPNKDDMVAGEWLHVDVDPSADQSLVDAERRRILERLENHSPRPCLIVDSGGGYQAFWRLDRPHTGEDGWSEFERWNRQLEADLGGDHCHNIDRIMRLPGTMNIPNKKKRARGRQPAPAVVVHQVDQVFDASVFPQAPLVDGGEAGDIGRARVQLSGNLPRLSEVDELDQHGEVSSYVKMLIVQGHDPDNPSRWPSRSECFWHVVCELVRCSIPDDVIASIVLDEDFAISGHCLDQRNPQGYAVRQLQRAHENAIDPHLPTLNDDHALVIRGGKVRIMKEMDHPKKGRVRDFMEVGAFKTYHSNKSVEIGQRKDGSPVTMPLGDWWVKSPHRRSYEGILFDPGGEAPEGYYNLWRGFSCTAVQGTLHQRWLDHVHDNICSGNDDHFDYVMGWCARLVQTPATQSETAIVLRGKEGTGKNSFVEGLAGMFPEHFYEANSSSHITGNFNSHLWDKVLIHANEAFFAGDKRQEASLKGLITDPNISIEAKGVDISSETNYMHLIMSSNSDWVVPAGPESRRFLVLDVGDGRMQDSEYFRLMKQDLREGGQSHLLRHLLDMDLSSFNVRAVPVTEALVDQRIRTMPKIGQWWMSRLERGYVVNSEDGWAREIEVEHIWKSYVSDMQEQSEHYRSTRVELGHFLHKVVPTIVKKRIQRGNSKRPYYHLPTLEECREMFDETMGGPFKWGETSADVQEEIPF